MEALRDWTAWLLSPQTLWIALWVGLGVFTVLLVLLINTRLGKSQPLRKCAILAIWFHLLLLIYATSIPIVAQRPGGGGQVTINLGMGEVSAQRTASSEKLPPIKLPETKRMPKAVAALPKSAAPRARTTSQSPAFAEAAPRTASQAVAAPPKSVSAPKPAAAAVAKLQAPAPSKSAAADRLPQVPSPRPLTDLPDPLVAMATSPAAASVTPTAKSLDMRAMTPIPERTPANSGVAAKLQPAELPVPRVPTHDAQLPLVQPHTSQFLPPQIYQQRIVADREQVALAHGGSAQTEAAVNAALQWLAKNQEADGRWSPRRFGAGQETEVLGHNRGGAGANADTGITGLAMLALLGAGHTHERGTHQKAVAGGIRYLIETQHPNGNLGGNAEPFAFMYCHGMATLALSESYAMTGDAALEEPVKRAVGYTLGAQNRSTGGWRYRPQEMGDLSQLGWQLMALKSAELAGVDIPTATREGMVRFVQSVSSGTNNGLASYRAGERVSRPMTAEALVCKQFLGIPRQNPAGDEAGNFLLGELPGMGERNYYYWYYGTLGMYQLQGDHWRRWNEALTTQLLQSQVTAGEAAGTWEPNDVWGGYGGRVYSTALATLCLEVYYRYLPLYVEAAANGAETQRK
ncbi:MAG: hypothetical protein C0483_14080 [Pirellula sp.]|nr:hypothetical protein [Pirellula sp.]